MKKSFFVVLLVVLFLVGCENQSIEKEIIFESNGGSAVENIIISSSDQTINLPIPTKEGYQFIGWYVDEQTNQEFIMTALSSETSITLYAKWEVKSYIVRFHLDGGIIVSGQETQSISHGQQAYPPLIEKPGYNYTWNKEYSVITSDTDIYALWELIQYTISFDCQGGSEIEPLQASSGEKVNLLEVPTREGYIFAGWYESIESIEEIEEVEVTDHDIVLYADWSTIGLQFDLTDDNLSYQVSIGDAIDIETIQIPKKYNNKYVTEISNYGFKDGYDVTLYVIPETIHKIGNFAFMNNYELSTILLPKSLALIGEYVFRFCHKLEGFIVDIDHEYFMVENHILYSKDGKTLIKYPQTLTSKVFHINDTVETVGVDAFSNNKFLEEVVFGSSVQVIKNYAFYDCIKLITVIIPNNILTIEYSAFRDCVELKNVVIGTGLTSIESYLFQNCVELEGIIIPANIEFIGYGAFYDCIKLISVTLMPHTSGNIIAGSAFMFTNCHSQLKIYVNNEPLMIKYKANYYWASYKNLFQVSE